MSRIEDKIIVLVNGKECDKTKDAILKKVVEKDKLKEDELTQIAIGLNITFSKLRKKFQKVGTEPIKLRPVALEICDWLEKIPAEHLKKAHITTDIVNYFKEWKQVLKPIE